MKIKDLTGKEREISSIKKISHKIHDAINGVDFEEDFVEVMIKGNNYNWPNWYPLEEFIKMNPEVKI